MSYHSQSTPTKHEKKLLCILSLPHILGHTGVQSQVHTSLRYYFECSYTCVCTVLTMSVLGIKHVLRLHNTKFTYLSHFLHIPGEYFEKSSLPPKLFHPKMCTMFRNRTQIVMDVANAASSMSLNRPQYSKLTQRTFSASMAGTSTHTSLALCTTTRITSQ
jgi:hypothetical protein